MSMSINNLDWLYGNRGGVKNFIFECKSPSEIKRLFFEAVLYIGQDVEHIYNKYFKKLVQNIISGKIEIKDEYTLHTFSSSKLKSQDCKLSHINNPVEIKLGVYKKGSLYNPKKNIIQISLDYDLSTQLNKVSNLSDFYNTTTPNTNFRISQLFSKDNILGSLYHELSHWVSDSLYSQHINRSMDSYNTGNSFAKLKGSSNINFTKEEINAQVHSLIPFFEEDKKEWAKFSLLDLMQLKSGLALIFGTLARQSSEKEFSRYQKDFLKRLNREKMLSPNMKPVSRKQILYILTH